MNITLTIKEAYRLLESCDAVVVNGDHLIFPTLSVLQFDGSDEYNELYDDNQFLYLGTDDGKFAAKFKQGDNLTVEASSHSLFLKDHEGDTIEITLLKIVELKSL